VLFSGLLNSIYITDLIPEFVYTFVVYAENEVGRSGVSSTVSVKLPRRPSVRDERIEPEATHAAMADMCKEAWGEYFDQKTGRPFYFNKITGFRTQEVPDVLKRSITSEVRQSEQEIARCAEVDFRKKRYRLLRTLHANKAGAGVLNLCARRCSIMWDSFDLLNDLPVGELRKRLKVSFEGEEGIDSGGLSKEFFLLVSKEILSYLV
jgi:hypothetical protein